MSREQFAALIYVGIALSAVGTMTVETYGAVQWFGAIDNLDFTVAMPAINLNNTSAGYPYITVLGSLSNPTDFNGLRVTYVVYTVFVGAEQNFTIVKDSSEVGKDSLTVYQPIPSGVVLNLTAQVPIYSDILVPLRSFLQNKTSLHVQPSIHVQAQVYFVSIYGTFSNFYCIEYPGNVSTICPAERPPPVSRGGGGG